jgi:hypothetical protein
VSPDRHCAQRFMYNYAVMHLALEAKLEAQYFNIRQSAQIEFEKEVALYNRGASKRKDCEGILVPE